MQLFVQLQQFSDVGLLILRLGLAAIFWTHGIAKKGSLKPPAPDAPPNPMRGVIRALAICEPLGALAMIGGLLTQLAAIGFVVVMIAAMKLKRGNKVPWSGGSTVGWEFEFITGAAALALVFLGPGAFSLDRILLGI